MAHDPDDSPLDRLWQEYGKVFEDFDDLTLARWMSQTLGQIRGKAWRLSHPLIGVYRLAAQASQDRQIWLKRLVAAPHGYAEATCCRAPLLPLLTREVIDAGLICQHCSETAVSLDDLPSDLQQPLREWAEEYAPVHAVAHWPEERRGDPKAYEEAFEGAATEAERLLLSARKELLPQLVEIFPAIVWEDQDECLEVRPEDLPG